MRYDLLIRRATLFDGTGRERFVADLGITDGVIHAIGALALDDAEREIDADGLAVAPGFIDAHTHDDRAVLNGPKAMECKLSQGVTSVVVGNCGVSLSPVAFADRPPAPLDILGASGWDFDSFARYAEHLEDVPPPVNVMALIGHMPLRVEALQGDVTRPANDREIERMRCRLEQALREGASGFSTGLWYPLNRAASKHEVQSIGSVLHAYDGLYCSHMRDEAAGVTESIDETVDAGRAMPAPVVISHHKCMFPENFGRSIKTLAQIEAAQETQTVDFDAYPYNAGSTSLFPDVVRPDVRITITWSTSHPEQAGRDLAEIASDWGLSLRDAAERLLPAGATYFQCDEADVQRILAHPRSMIGSDGLPHDRFPHPRLWGTFPRILGHYARDVGLFTLEAAIEKMTNRTARVFGFEGRGVLAEGAYADLVMFDPQTVIDTATFAKPVQAADGILETWVNGVSAYRNGEGVSGRAAGRLVRRHRR
jgi:N-acyl-D-amino-acid deacylase